MLLAGGTGALALSAGAGLLAIQPERQRVTKPRPGRLPSGLKVTVIGGGLAGLSAALELAERGAQVRLIEAAPQFGGKLSGWNVDKAGESFAVEHGFHGFFSQYYNFNDVLTRLGVNEVLKPATRYPIAFSDGGEESFPPQKSLFPANLLRLYVTSDRLKWRRLAEAGPDMRALLEYHPIKTYAALDDVPFSAISDKLDPELVQAMLWPFAKTTLNHPARTSAAHVLRFMHFYFLGNPEGLSYRMATKDCMTAIITPWTNRLRTLGVILMPSTRVHSLRMDGDRVVSVKLRPDPTAAIATLPTTLGTKPQTIGHDTQGFPLFAWLEDGVPTAVRGQCTHQGCPIGLSTTGFDCPCHGGKFDHRGVPFSGPPKAPLPRLRVLPDGAVHDPVDTGIEEVATDEVVLACDVRGTRAILQSSNVSHSLQGQAKKLGEADPYSVVRLWLDRQPNPDRCEFYTTTGFRLLDSIAIYDRFQDESRSWAKRTGHSIVELHAYAITPEDDLGPERNRELMIQEMKQAMPELRDAKVLDHVTMQQSNFSGFAPGSHAARPTTQTPHPNLFLAGDWVKSDLPIALMEAAVTTGRLAANAILQKHGAGEVTIDTVQDHGILA